MTPPEHLALAKELSDFVQTLPTMVQRMIDDPTALQAGRDAFDEFGGNVYAEEWDEAVSRSLDRGLLDFPRWALAAAYLAATGSQANLARVATHPITTEELFAEFGEESVRAAHVEQGEGLHLELGGVVYVAHPELPLWRRGDVALCKAHGLAKAPTVDMETGEAIEGCPKCMREAS